MVTAKFHQPFSNIAMNKSKLIQYYNNQSDTFQRYFNQAQESMEMEAIHQMRVAIKKLKAIWCLLEMLSDKKWKKTKHFSLVKNLFKSAGKLRETQLNLLMTEQFEDINLPEYTEDLIKQEKNYSKKLTLSLEKFELQKLERLNAKLLKAIINIPDDIVLKQALANVKKRNKKIAKTKGLLFNEHKLHKIRIQLKAMQEILAVIEELNTNNAMVTLRSQIKSLNEHIGQWHDYKILSKSLKQFLSKNPHNQNTSLIKNVIKDINSEQKERQQEIFGLIEMYVAEHNPKLNRYI